MSIQILLTLKPVPRPPVRILYVEDQPAVVAIVKLELVRARMDVTTVTSGERCLALVREQPFDLILMDPTLPCMSGLEVCRRLKADGVLKLIPVIFFTAFPEQAQEREARRLGAADYLQKCFHTTQLAVRILAAVGVARAVASGSMDQERALSPLPVNRQNAPVSPPALDSGGSVFHERDASPRLSPAQPPESIFPLSAPVPPAGAVAV